MIPLNNESPAVNSGPLTSDADRLRKLRVRQRLADSGGVLSIFSFFVTVVLLFSFTTNTFMSQANLLNVMRQIAPLLIVAVAMTFVITTGGIDLSVGSVLAVVNVVTAIGLQSGIPWPIMVLTMLLLGAAIGALQGFFIAYEGIPAFIVTLAGLTSLRGVALLLTKGYSIPVDPRSVFNVIGRGWILGIPFPALIALCLLFIGAFVFTNTPFGRYVTGIGSNAESVRRAGINSRRISLYVYILSGFAAAAAGLITVARLGGGSSKAGQGFELEAIAAVVLGGAR